MREETRTKTITKEYKVYTAYDGKEFSNAQDCIVYEKYKYRTDFHENIPKIVFAINLNDIYEDNCKDCYNDFKGSCVVFRAIPIANEKEVEIINGFLAEQTNYANFHDKKVTNDKIGETIIIGEDSAGFWYADDLTVEIIQERVMSSFKNITKDLKIIREIWNYERG